MEKEKKSVSTLEKIESLQETVVRLERKVMAVHSQTVEYLVNEFDKLKMQMANIAKTVAAVTGTLTSKGSITGEEVMLQIKRIDEKNAKDEIQELLSAKLIEEREVSESHSIIAVSVSVLDKKEGSNQEVSSYTKVDLSAYADGDDTKMMLVGKKVGETIEISSNNKDVMVLYTVLGVYGLSDKAIRGEEQGSVDSEEK